MINNYFFLLKFIYLFIQNLDNLVENQQKQTKSFEYIVK